MNTQLEPIAFHEGDIRDIDHDHRDGPMDGCQFCEDRREEREFLAKVDDTLERLGKNPLDPIAVGFVNSLTVA